MQLVVATEEEKRSRDPLTHRAWGQRISQAAWFGREERLRAHPWCGSGMTTWLWKDEAGAVLASCETFRMRSLRRHEGAEQEGVGFGVASVFTEERLRGRGHALAMMQALSAELRRCEPRAHAILLFSEVGATLYQRAGYEPRLCHDRIFAVEAAAAAPAEARWIGEHEVEGALARFALPDAPFVVWPTAAQIDWHLERARIYAEALGRGLPATCGVELPGARALWAADYKNERLAILLAEAADPGAAQQLVQAASAAALAAGLAEVRIWETPSLPLQPEVGRRVPRDDDALPMLLPLAPGVLAEDWRDIPRALWV